MWDHEPLPGQPAEQTCSEAPEVRAGQGGGQFVLRQRQHNRKVCTTECEYEGWGWTRGSHEGDIGAVGGDVALQDGRERAHDAGECHPRQRQAFRVPDGRHGRRPRLVGQQRDLAEVVACLEAADLLGLLAGGRGLGADNLALLYYVKGVPRFSFANDLHTTGELDMTQGISDCQPFAFRQVCENRNFLQETLIKIALFDSRVHENELECDSVDCPQSSW
eukprot:CAMPEP_0196659662 /NCGR_PEP_ID=MMETSP1086-20130531/36130_1 /TAXON_ID=77921 /ORGANISM="Cyanoptyche  gloeocystis , Strain SAG4.97" /LENGTH=219 /DNA_ID=CAMNT_0041993731 /DNA_START=71 /DNA_END=731 /DNA_ORIENTATION=+